MNLVSPKKSLGQHFLTDKNISQKIIAEFQPLPNEPIVEIGPGTGALTTSLVQSGCNLLAIELDKRSVEHLNSVFDNKIQILQQDFLKINFSEITKHFVGEKVRVIGNIPYYITSAILVKIIENNNHISQALLMMQREVAERLVAKPRTKQYGALSVFMQTHSTMKILFHVTPKSFFPPPKVQSSVIRITMNDTYKQITDITLFQKIVQSGFSQRRKTLKNSLAKAIENPEIRSKSLAAAGIIETQRAEELTFQEFINLANITASIL